MESVCSTLDTFPFPKRAQEKVSCVLQSSEISRPCAKLISLPWPISTPILGILIGEIATTSSYRLAHEDGARQPGDDVLTHCLTECPHSRPVNQFTLSRMRSTKRPNTHGLPSGEHSRGDDGRIPLSMASEFGHPDVVRLLLECGVDADARDNERSTPLHLASSNGRIAVVRVLLEHGADLDAEDIGGLSPFQIASFCGREEVTRLLTEHRRQAQDEGDMRIGG
ncbi:ankyrin repeat-containing domain protein [Lactarius pseudohatsudake]|nr:ankyrin repeat-containing domain protein [Lactarius pseudohatsudake]